MNLNLFFIHTSYFFISITCIYSYVLVATNADDFRSIAKKIIPNQLADKLADIALKSAKRYGQDFVREESEESDDSTQYEDFSRSSPNPQFQGTQKSRLGIEKQVGNLDFDELVRRVREQLESEYKTSTVAANFAKPEGGKINYDYKDDNPSERWTKLFENKQGQRTPSHAFTTKKQQYVEYNEANAHEEYVDENKNIRQSAPYNKNVNFANENENMRQDTPYNMKNVKVPEYTNRNVKEEADYENINVKDVPSHQNIKEGTYLYGGIQNTRASDKEVQYVEGNTAVATEYNEDNENNAPKYYEDDAGGTQDTVRAADADTFKKVDMIKSNDSYEDYVTPARDNVFASAEHTNMKPIKGVQRFVVPDQSKYNQNNRPQAVADVYLKRENLNDDVVTPARMLPREIVPQQSQQSVIKAKTESLWYKDADFQNYDDSKTTTMVPIGGMSSTKRKNVRGTMFPTRFRLKISSPNYLAKMPAVAQKYNFNEPIPERDREHENIKHIRNPPALVNKKIRI